MNLCFSGHELQENPRKPDSFLGQIAATLVNAKHVVPADSEGSVDRLKYGIEPPRQIALFWNFKRNTTVANLRLSAEEPLAHGFGLNKKGMCDTNCVQPQNRLQH